MNISIDTGEKEDIKLGARGLEDLRQCIKILMSTIKGSVFLDRRFGIDGSVIDMPINRLGTLFEAINTAIEEYEPRVEVLEIVPYRSTLDGAVEVKVKFKIREEELNGLGLKGY